MQSIQGKKESLLRVLGMILILLGLFISVLFDYFIVGIMIYLLIILIFIPWFILIVLLKLEKEFFVDNMSKFFVILICYTVVLFTMGFIINNVESTIFLISGISIILIIFCWHYALSIYKKEKLIFLLSGIISSILTLIFKISILIVYIGLLFALTSILLILLGIIAVIFAELRMKKKGLLNYV